MKKNLLVMWLIFGLIIIFAPRPSQADQDKEIIYVPEIEVIVLNKTVSARIKERVEFTNFYPGDNMNTNTMTSTGHTISDFQVNDNGWYTWHGKVVIATATTTCIEVQTGACGNFNEEKDTHHYFDLYDVVEIIFEGEHYQAVVLSSCGACNWDEELQRVDIFVSDSYYDFGKVKGGIIY